MAKRIKPKKIWYSIDDDGCVWLCLGPMRLKVAERHEDFHLFREALDRQFDNIQKEISESFE